MQYIYISTAAALYFSEPKKKNGKKLLGAHRPQAVWKQFPAAKVRMDGYIYRTCAHRISRENNLARGSRPHFPICRFVVVVVVVYIASESICGYWKRICNCELSMCRGARVERERGVGRRASFFSQVFIYRVDIDMGDMRDFYRRVCLCVCFGYIVRVWNIVFVISFNSALRIRLQRKLDCQIPWNG